VRVKCRHHHSPTWYWRIRIRIRKTVSDQIFGAMIYVKRVVDMNEQHNFPKIDQPVCALTYRLAYRTSSANFCAAPSPEIISMLAAVNSDTNKQKNERFKIKNGRTTMWSGLEIYPNRRTFFGGCTNYRQVCSATFKPCDERGRSARVLYGFSGIPDIEL